MGTVSRLCAGQPKLCVCPIHLAPRALFLAVKQPGCEGEHSPPSAAEVDND